MLLGPLGFDLREAKVSVGSVECVDVVGWLDEVGQCDTYDGDADFVTVLAVDRATRQDA